VINISNPANPTLTGSSSLPGAPRDIKAGEGVVYIGLSDNGLSIMNVENPAAPIETGHFNTAGSAHGLP